MVKKRFAPEWILITRFCVNEFKSTRLVVEVVLLEDYKEIVMVEETYGVTRV